MPLGASRLSFLGHPAWAAPVSAVYYPSEFGEQIQAGSSGSTAGYRDLAITNNIGSATDDFTLSVWIKPTLYSIDTDPWIVYSFVRSDQNTNHMLRIYDNGSVNFYTNWGGGFADRTVLGSGTLTADTWHHLAVSHDASADSTQIYLDGVDTTPAVTAGLPTSAGIIMHTTTFIGVSAWGRSDAAGTNWAGFGDRMAQLWWDDSYVDLDTNIGKFYSNGYINMGTDGTGSGLSAPLVYHYGADSNTFTTASGQTSNLNYTLSDNEHGTMSDGDRTAVVMSTVGNAAITNVNYQFGSGALTLDGVNDRVQNTSTDFSQSGDFTAECWFYATSTSGTRCLFAIGNESTGRQFVNVQGSNLYTDEYGAGGIDINGTGNGVSASTWHHCALSRSGTTVSLYLDGTRVGSTTSSDTVGNANGIYIGTLSDGAVDFVGQIDEFRLSNNARYTGASYTVPTEAFTNDSNTKLLLHFNDSNNSTLIGDDIT
jgi:hypothetical protein